jgi:hypothetical protein
MGLFVVGRLAARHGVRVRLRHAQAGGLTALIWLPETVAAPEVAPPLGRLRRFEADDFGPAPSLSAPPAPNATASSQAAAAARIPRFSAPGPTVSPSFTPSPGSQQGTGGPQIPPQVSPLPSRNGSAPGMANGTSAPADAGPAFGSDTIGTGPSRLPSFGGQPPVRGGDGPSAEDPLRGADPFGDDMDDVATGNMPLIDADAASDWPGHTAAATATGPHPMPTVNGNGMAGTGQVTIPPSAAQDQRLPIFDSLESDWFRRSGKSMSSSPRPGTGPQPVVAAAQTASTWTSPADDGWRAAQVVAAPAAGETTQAGLPKRVPRANLVPGSVGGGGGHDADATVSTAPARTAEDIRSRMSSFQRGVREGRAAAPQIEEQ